MTNITLSTMELSIETNIAVLTLTRENALNAMNQVFFDDVKTTLNRIKKNIDVKALIIIGRGNGFSVGADLKEFTSDEKIDLGARLRKNFEPMVLELKKLPFPTIAAVNGYAAGAGMGLMLGCDFTIAARSAQFVQAFINIALVPDAGSSYFLPRLVGRARATEMMMLGENISADDAYNMGLIYKVVDDKNLLDEAIVLAKKLCEKPTKTLIQIRDLLDASHDNTFVDQLEAEANAQTVAGKCDNFIEGVSAFKEKRKPNFK